MYMKCVHPIPMVQFERSRRLQCDMLTSLMSVRSDKQRSLKCSEGQILSLRDISLPRLIAKYFSGAYTPILL